MLSCLHPKKREENKIKLTFTNRSVRFRVSRSCVCVCVAAAWWVLRLCAGFTSFFSCWFFPEPRHISSTPTNPKQRVFPLVSTYSLLSWRFADDAPGGDRFFGLAVNVCVYCHFLPWSTHLCKAIIITVFFFRLLQPLLVCCYHIRMANAKLARSTRRASLLVALVPRCT